MQFKKKEKTEICSKFKVGTQGVDYFKYVGLQVAHTNGIISLDQKHYFLSVKEVEVHSTSSRHKHDALNDTEHAQFKSGVGQLNWVANQTRPDISFDVMYLSMKAKNAEVEDMILMNKVIRNLHSRDSFIVFPKRQISKGLKFYMFIDASFANLPDGVSSSSGFLLFLVDADEQCNLISWSSTKIKRVIKSTLAAEAHAIEEGIDADVCMSSHGLL